MIEHFVQFYEDDAFLVTQVTSFLRPGLSAGDVVIVVVMRVEEEPRSNTVISEPLLTSGCSNAWIFR